MIKIALLSGAYKNAGDFLITLRAKKLLEKNIDDVSITTYLRNNIEANLEEINKVDLVVISGGPVYMTNITRLFDINIAKSITRPIMILGGGWYGYGNGSDQIYQYTIDTDSLNLLKHIDDMGIGLSCRDACTKSALAKYDFKHIFLTGCPAWYDLDNIQKTTIDKEFKKIKNIIVSDPARQENYIQVISVVKYLKKRFPNSNITFVFHRGNRSDSYTDKKSGAVLLKLENGLKQFGVTIKDISYGSDGFAVYDECDLHIGYRVHAHIYCLSKRLRTILIEEDGRGAGVNRTLGLCSIKAYNDKFQLTNRYLEKLYRMYPMSRNKYVIYELNDYLDILSITNDQPLNNSFELMKKYYNCMVGFISRINYIDFSKR